MSWREEYESKFISAEEAAAMVKSGDFVAFTMGREAFACGMALSARKGELTDVSVLGFTPSYDFGWDDNGWDDSLLTLPARLPPRPLASGYALRPVDNLHLSLVLFGLKGVSL